MESQLPEGDTFPRFRAAAVQAASVFLDRDATLDKMEGLVAEAARNGAQLIVFPESFIPAFPVWNLVLPPVDQHRWFRALYEQAVPVPGPAVERIGDLARRHGVHLSVGVTERSAVSMGGLYNTNLFFDDTGTLRNRHRKLVPTWAEKLSWAPGDARDLAPVDTRLGKIGTLICGENTNTLARYALLAQGEQVHIATYPSAWPFRRPGSAKNYDLTRAIEIRSAAHAFEGKVFNVVASGVLDERAIAMLAEADPSCDKTLRSAPPPTSMIVDPTGSPVGEPLVADEGILYGDIDVADSIEAKQVHDIVGNYQRFDVFRLEIDRRPQEPLHQRHGNDEPRRDSASSRPETGFEDGSEAGSVER